MLNVVCTLFWESNPLAWTNSRKMEIFWPFSLASTVGYRWSFLHTNTTSFTYTTKENHLLKKVYMYIMNKKVMNNIPFVTPNSKLLRIHYVLQFCEFRNLPFVLIRLDLIQQGGQTFTYSMVLDDIYIDPKDTFVINKVTVCKDPENHFWEFWTICWL